MFETLRDSSTSRAALAISRLNSWFQVAETIAMRRFLKSVLLSLKFGLVARTDLIVQSFADTKPRKNIIQKLFS